MSVSYKIEAVPARQLVIDPKVQRLEDPARIRKLASAWEDQHAGVLTVSRRINRTQMSDGSGALLAEEFVVLDGQTRLHAYRLVMGSEDTAAPLNCQVYQGLTQQEEAAIFLAHNDRKAVHVRDRFRLAVTANEEWALDIRDLAARFGWAAQGLNGGSDGLRRYSAISAVERVYRLDDGVALKHMFETVDNAWPGQRDGVTTETVLGFGLLFARHPELTSKQVQGLVSKLRRMTPGQFAAEVVTDRRRHGTSLAQAAYLYAVALYNKGRDEANRI